MYIRTKDGTIYDLESKEVSSWEYIDNDTALNEYGVEGAFYTIYYFDENKGHYSEYDGKGGHSCVFIEEKDILKQSDTIEELIQDNDMIYIHDLYPDVVLVVEGNIKPFGYNNSIKLKEWLKFKFTEFDLYIKQSNGDYHKIAEKKQYGKLVLA